MVICVKQTNAPLVAGAPLQNVVMMIEAAGYPLCARGLEPRASFALAAVFQNIRVGVAGWNETVTKLTRKPLADECPSA